MTVAPTPPPVHSSVRTSTSLNTDAAGLQLLTVITSRLLITWRDGDMTVAFGMQRVRTAVLKRAQNDDPEPLPGRRGREEGAF